MPHCLLLTRIGLGLGLATSASLPLAVQDFLPIVRPGEEAALGGAQGMVLVVAGGEQDVFPHRPRLHACWKKEGIFEDCINN